MRWDISQSIGLLINPSTISDYQLKPLKNRLFWITTLIPTALAIVYFGLIASDVYISESRFVVRSPERETASPFGLLLKGAGFSKAQDDAYIVQDYILSRDALQSLDNEYGVKNIYSSPSIDIFNRFAALDFDHSFEALYRYFIRKVSVQLDSTSSIMTLTTQAYSANDAFTLNSRLLELSEKLVNKLNERARADLIVAATNEVQLAQRKDIDASIALASYRNDQGVIDPDKQSAIQLQQIAKLNEDLLTTKSQIQQLELLAPNNSQLPVLRQHVTLLDKQITNETQHVAGLKNSSLAAKATVFYKLIQEKEFTAKMLASTMSSLEQARSEAQRKQLYLERVIEPSKPDFAMEPKRIRGICIVFVLGLIAWGILSMLLAGIKEHKD